MTAAGRAWRRAGRGMLVIGIGVFLLLNTTGWLSWVFWFQLLAFWPVVLVALGVRLIFDRSRFPAAVLLSPLLILATMAFVAVRGPEVRHAGGRHLTLRAERPQDLRHWTLEGHVAYGALDLRVEDAPGETLLTGEAVTRRVSRPVRVYAGTDSARVRFGAFDRRRFIAIGPPFVRWSRWELAIAPDLPVDVDLQLALADGRLDFSGVEVASLEVQGAFNDIDLWLGAPDKNVRLDLEGAFNRFKLIVPSSVPVRLQTDGFLNFADGSRGGKGPGYRVQLDGAFNRLEVERQAGP